MKSDEITTPQEDPAFWNNTELKFWVTGDTTVTVQKEWVGDSEADRKEITVQLLANGQKLDGMTKTLTKGSDWKAAFTNLPGIKDGKKIEYSVEEVNTPDGYTSKVEKIDDSNVIKVVNTSNKPTTTTTEATTTTESTTAATTTAATTTTESTTAATTAATTTTESTTAATTAATTTTESTTAATTAATTTTESTTAATTAATTTTESSTVSTTAATTTTESTTAATTEGSTTGNTTTVVAPTPGTTTTTPSPELPNTGSIRDAYWVLSAIFATIGAIVFVTNKKAEEK